MPIGLWAHHLFLFYGAIAISPYYKVFKMYRSLFFVLFSIISTSLFAQSWQMVKNDSRYYVGEGKGVTLQEADDAALSAIISQIAVKVSSESEIRGAQVEKNGQVLSSEVSSEAKVKTYSNATLTNTQREILKQEPNAHVARWILKSEVDKIFKAREFKIKEFVAAASRSENKGQIDNALKYLSWAHALLPTLQRPDTVSHIDEQGKRHQLSVWLTEHIDQILRNVQVSVLSRTGDDVQISVAYANNPVSSLDFSYFDGRDWSPIVYAKDGLGVLELAAGNLSSAYDVKIEFEYREQSHIDNDVDDAYKIMPTQVYRSAYKKVSTKQVATGSRPLEIAVATASETSAAASSFSSVPEAIFKKPELVADDAPYSKVLNHRLQSIAQRQYEGVQQYFTPEGYDIYKRLIGYGQASVVGTPKCAFYSFGDRVMARGLQMAFSFKSGMHKRFVEEVVFTFDAQRKIENVAFGLGKTAEDDIMGKGVWPEKARMAMMQFLENYKTAYALKRLDYIEGIFDEDAVIITGTVIKQAPKSDDMGNIQLPADVVRYSRYNKRSYLQHLRRSFNSKEYINLRFADNDVQKMGRGGELYAVQISQEYFSPNYGDKGYLFLMVDINDPESPIIKVRTWQPDKDPNFGLYGPELFR